MAERTVKVTLLALPQGLVAGFAVGAKATKEFGNELNTLATKHEASFNKLTNMAGAVGIGLVGAFALATKSTMAFDKQMSAVAAVADASTKQMGALRDASIKAGQDTAYTATQAAQGEEELAKAGISTADILSGGLKGALSLAAAGSLDLADAATYASQAMIEFNLHGKDMAHIADVLTAGANKSVTDVKGLGEALGQAGTVAHQAGMSLDETVGVLALFSQHGLDGVEAGTTFKQMLLKLEGPSGKSAALMQSLGLSVYDTNGNFVSASVLADRLQKSLGGLTQEQRNAALAQIFGSRAVRGAIDLYNAGAAGVDEWTAAVNDQGIATKTANTKLNNLSGDVKKLEGSLQALAITGSGGATAGLRVFAQGAEGAVNWVSKLPKPLQEAGTLTAGFGGTAILAAVGFVKAKGAISQFMDTLEKMGPTGAKAASGLGKIGSIGGKLGLVGVGLFGIVEGYEALAHWLDKKNAPVKRDIDGLTLSLTNLSTGLGVGGEIVKAFGKDLAGLTVDVSKVDKANSMLKQLNAAQAIQSKSMAGRGGIYLADQQAGVINNSKQARSDVSALDTALSQLATNGGANQARIAFDDLAASQHWSATQTRDAISLLPQYVAATHGAAAANTGLAQGFGDAAANAATMTNSLADAIEKGATFESLWKQLNGALAGTDSARLTASQDLKQLTKDLKDNKNAVKGNSDAALTDRVDMEKYAQDAAKVADAVLAQTGSLDDAQGAWDQYIASLRKTLLQSGLTKKEVDALIKSIGKMPPLVSTKVEAPGLVAANGVAEGYYAVMNHLNGKVVKTTVHTSYVVSGKTGQSRNGGIDNAVGGVYEHAAVGALRDANVYHSVATGARYAFAEPSTGGEAFIPKHGDMGRSRGIADYAVSNWLGGSINWGGGGRGGGGAGGGTTVVDVHVHAGSNLGGKIVEGLRFEVFQRTGGNVQKAIGR